MSFVQTVQGRGAPTSNIDILKDWLIEHLGVAYRGYLLLDPYIMDNYAKISITTGENRTLIPAITVPMASQETRYIELPINSQSYKLVYTYGTLDEEKRNYLVIGKKAKYYYQKNQKTQGIDIRLGKRVIATHQLETIWKVKDGSSQLMRHNNFNDFVGELIIPEVPRGFLTTINNKTDFNLDDIGWKTIFGLINDIRPPEKQREKSEAVLRKKWMKKLTDVNSNDVVTDEYGVWPTKTSIDVLRTQPDGSITIYEIKIGTGTPINLYQLKMYWDGLVINGKQPKEAILLVEDYRSNLKEMADMMNSSLNPPDFSSNQMSSKYNFVIKKHSEVGLDE